MNVKAIRESKKMTQAEVAKNLNVSRTTVTMWETGESRPRAEKLIQLAKLFNCTVDELLKD